MRYSIFLAVLLLFISTIWSWPADSLWVAYAPTNFNPNVGQFPSEESIAEDLDALFSHHYRGLCTYGAENTLGLIPRIAREHGFIGRIIMGIWNPASAEEWSGALAASDYVDGYCIGNEGLTFPYAPPNNYDTTMLMQAMDSLRYLTGKPVTTSEPIDVYFAGEFSNFLLNHCDWLFPIIHPYWHGCQTPQAAAQWTLEMYDSLRLVSEMTVIIKEEGWPTEGATSANADFQAHYFEVLLDSMQAGWECKLFFFEAFDQYWKNWHPVEPYWGLFDRFRVAKPAVGVIESYFIPTGIAPSKQNSSSPAFIVLDDIHPNPCNTTVSISFTLSEACFLVIELFSPTGAPLLPPLLNGWISPGHYQKSYDISHLSSGTYLVRMRAGNNSF